MRLRHDGRITACLFSEPFGQFDDLESVGTVPDFSKSNDELQTLDGVGIDEVVLWQPLRFVIAIVGIVSAHNNGSRGG